MVIFIAAELDIGGVDFFNGPESIRNGSEKTGVCEWELEARVICKSIGVGVDL